MLGVIQVLASGGGDVTPAWYSPAAVFAVVLGLLTVVFGVAWAIVAGVSAWQRARERRAVDSAEGMIPSASLRRRAEPLPPTGRAIRRRWPS